MLSAKANTGTIIQPGLTLSTSMVPSVTGCPNRACDINTQGSAVVQKSLWKPLTHTQSRHWRKHIP